MALGTKTTLCPVEVMGPIVAFNMLDLWGVLFIVRVPVVREIVGTLVEESLSSSSVRSIIPLAAGFGAGLLF